MTVGTNSYVTVTEAGTYISGHYRSNSTDRKRWEAIEEADKEVLLINACEELELLPFRGRKASSTQVLAFPRLPFQYGNVDDAPENIKRAQIELALWLSDDQKQADQSQRRDLQAQGVESFSIDDLSESYKTGGSDKAVPLLCPKVSALLRPYLTGGFNVC